MNSEGSLAYDGAPLWRVPLCVSTAFLVLYKSSLAATSGYDFINM